MDLLSQIYGINVRNSLYTPLVLQIYYLLHMCAQMNYIMFVCPHTIRAYLYCGSVTYQQVVTSACDLLPTYLENKKLAKYQLCKTVVIIRNICITGTFLVGMVFNQSVLVVYHITGNIDGKYWRIGFIQKFYQGNIDGQSLRQPVFAIQLKILKGKILTDCQLSVKSVNISPVKISCYTVVKLPIGQQTNTL